MAARRFQIMLFSVFILGTSSSAVAQQNEFDLKVNVGTGLLWLFNAGVCGNITVSDYTLGLAAESGSLLIHPSAYRNIYLVKASSNTFPGYYLGVGEEHHPVERNPVVRLGKEARVKEKNRKYWYYHLDLVIDEDSNSYGIYPGLYVGWAWSLNNL